MPHQLHFCSPLTLELLLDATDEELGLIDDATELDWTEETATLDLTEDATLEGALDLIDEATELEEFLGPITLAIVPNKLLLPEAS